MLVTIRKSDTKGELKMSINKMQIVGNLGNDPELRFTSTGTALCNLRIATSERWTDKQTGEKKERVEWHRVTVFGPSAESCAKYLSKGRQVMVEGKLRTRSYEKEGVKHFITEIVANPGGVQFLGSAKGNQSELVAPQDAPVDDVDSTDIPL